MLITLFILEIILIGIIVFTTQMVEHKFVSIRASLDRYCNKRTYKTKADIHFVEMMIAEYNRLCSDTDEEPDLSSAVSLKLHKEYIGRFSYVSVINTANKAKYLMWGIFVAEILITWLNKMANNGKSLIVIFASLLLSVIMCFYGIIKGLNERQETLIDEVTHYIRNVYPMEVRKQKKAVEEKRNKEKESNLIANNVTQFSDIKKQIKKLDESVEEAYTQEEINKQDRQAKVEKMIDELIKNKPQNGSELSASDIAQLLRNL